MGRRRTVTQDVAAFTLLTGSYKRTSPWPRTIYFTEVSPSRPTGPRACSLSFETPISAPRPYSKPSAKRVEALTITLAESTSRKNRMACADQRRRSPILHRFADTRAVRHSCYATFDKPAAALPQLSRAPLTAFPSHYTRRTAAFLRCRKSRALSQDQRHRQYKHDRRRPDV